MRTQLSGGPVQHRVHELVAVGRAEPLGEVDGFGEVDDAVALLEVGDLPVEFGGGRGEGSGVVGGLLRVADAVVVEDKEGRGGWEGLDQTSGSGKFAGSCEECFLALDGTLPGLRSDSISGVKRVELLHGEWSGVESGEFAWRVCLGRGAGGNQG